MYTILKWNFWPNLTFGRLHSFEELYVWGRMVGEILSRERM